MITGEQKARSAARARIGRSADVALSIAGLASAAAVVCFAVLVLVFVQTRGDDAPVGAGTVVLGVLVVVLSLVCATAWAVATIVRVQVDLHAVGD